MDYKALNLKETYEDDGSPKVEAEKKKKKMDKQKQNTQGKFLISALCDLSYHGCWRKPV